MKFELILPNDVMAANKLAANAAKIALNSFEWRYATMVLHNSTMILGLSAFMQIYRKSVVIGKGTFPHADELSADRICQFVVFGSTLLNIKHILDWVRQRKFDNTGKFIFICRGCDERDAMNIFWDHKIINLVFINGGDSASKIVGYTFSVYDSEHCLISPPIGLQESCIRNSCLFPMKLKNLNFCPLIVSTFIQVPYMYLKNGIPKGADGDLLALIGEALNATLKVMMPHRGDGWGIPDKNGNWMGSFGDIYNDHANVSMTTPAVTMMRFREFQMSTVYNSASVVWVTHPAIQLPAWQKLLRPFQTNARICLAVSYLMVLLVAVVVRSNLWLKFTQRNSSGKPRKSVIFDSWAICMGMPTTSLPSKPAFLIIFMLFIFYCFMIRTFYQAALIHAMKDDSNYPEFQNLEDILKSGYPLGGVVTLREYFIETPYVYNNWKAINSTDIFQTMVKLSNGMKYVLAMNKNTAKNFLRKRYGELHIVPQKIVVNPSALFFKKFSPLAAAVNRVLGQLTESGFTQKIYKNHVSVTATKKTESTVPMNIEHYKGCYFVLVVGWIVSIITFLLEIYCYKCKVILLKRTH